MAKRKSKKDQIVEVELTEFIPETVVIDVDKDGNEIRTPVEWRDDYRGVLLLLRRVEPDLARSWAMRQRKIFLEEKRRRIEDAHAEEIYGDDFSNEFYEESIQLSKDILEATVVGMKNIEGIGENDPEGAIEEIVYLNIQGAVKERAQAIQFLSARQRFRAAGDRRGGDSAGSAGPQ